MADHTVTLRDLNRALLARQMLLDRVDQPVLAAIETLAGLQAQIPRAPYVGLWTRLEHFQRDDLAGLIADRAVVKATLMRGTLHFFTTRDYVRHRATLAPMLAAAAEAMRRQRKVTLDEAAILAVVEPYLAAQPRTFKDISALLTERYPAVDVGGMRYTVRSVLPLVQVPNGARWSYPGNPQFALAEDWIVQRLAPAGDLRDLVWRYLGAFGPASIADFQAWSGLGGMKAAFETWRSDLYVVRDERGRELFDLPDAPRPTGDTPAPVRFIPELDNLLIGHDERRRIMADEYRMRVMKVNGQGSITFLVDGFVRGVATVESSTHGAALVLDPFEPVSAPDRAALIDEGERLIRFIEPDAKAYDVRFSNGA